MRKLFFMDFMPFMVIPCDPRQLRRNTLPARTPVNSPSLTRDLAVHDAPSRSLRPSGADRCTSRLIHDLGGIEDRRCPRMRQRGSRRDRRIRTRCAGRLVIVRTACSSDMTPRSRTYRADAPGESRHCRADAAGRNRASSDPPSLDAIVHGWRMIVAMSSSDMLNETIDAPPASTMSTAACSGVTPRAFAISSRF